MEHVYFLDVQGLGRLKHQSWAVLLWSVWRPWSSCCLVHEWWFWRLIWQTGFFKASVGLDAVHNILHIFITVLMIWLICLYWIRTAFLLLWEIILVKQPLKKSVTLMFYLSCTPVHSRASVFPTHTRRSVTDYVWECGVTERLNYGLIVSLAGFCCWHHIGPVEVNYWNMFICCQPLQQAVMCMETHTNARRRGSLQQFTGYLAALRPSPLPRPCFLYYNTQLAVFQHSEESEVDRGGSRQRWSTRSGWQYPWQTSNLSRPLQHGWTKVKPVALKA